MLTTTLNEILKYDPCKSGWDILTGQGTDKSHWVGNDELLGFDKILKSNGLSDAIWACRALEDEDLKRFKLWVCDIAERALIYVPEGEDRPRVAIETARKYLKGECSKDDLNAAARAADAAVYTAAYAVNAAVNAAYAVFYVGSAVNTADHAARAAAYAACSTAYAARAAAYAACSTAYAARAAAAIGATTAEREIQKEMFIEFING